MRESLLSWQRYRYLKASLLLGAASIALYLSQNPNGPQPRNGGTWQGYTLGTLGALLIVWLTVLGVRKRRYSSTMGTVQGWTSAHVYLGTLLLLVATLHCAAQFGWNVHTLAYVLMCLVIVTGLYGLYVYLHLPGGLSRNNAGKDREAWLQELAEVDEGIRKVLDRCDAHLQALVLSALDLTRLGGGVVDQLLARDRCRVRPYGALVGSRSVSNREQRVVIEELSTRIPDARKQAEAEVLNELLALFGRRRVILQLLGRDIQYRALLKIWLYFHIPLTISLLAALSVHILSVFIYW
jgi:hypothetical protein